MQDASTKRTALLSAVMASFLTHFMVSSVNIAMPITGRELGMNAVLLGWVPTSYLLAAAMLLVPFGRIADIHGRKRIFTIGIVVYTVASGLIAFTETVAALLALRVVQGFGSAMIFGTGIAGWSPQDPAPSVTMRGFRTSIRPRAPLTTVWPACRPGLPVIRRSDAFAAGTGRNPRVSALCRRARSLRKTTGSDQARPGTPAGTSTDLPGLQSEMAHT